MKEFS
jgi:hypothetical protein